MIAQRAKVCRTISNRSGCSRSRWAISRCNSKLRRSSSACVRFMPVVNLAQVAE